MAPPPDSTEGPNTLRDLGRKARARLHEEQTKRREVQRCDGATPTESSTKQRGTLLVSPPKKKRRSTIRRKSTSSDKTHEQEEENIDRWTPDISSVVAFHKEQEGKKTSSVIQLHGVPTDTVPSTVRRFLSGLEPFSLFLLAFPSTFLPALDANDEDSIGGPSVTRIQCPFRLLVRMTHSTVAKLAVDRSGEMMADTTAVAVTRIANQTLAQTLLEHLAVPWTDNDTTLQQAGEQLVAQLDPHVPDILWTAVEQEIRGLLGPHKQHRSEFSVPGFVSKKKRFTVTESQQLRDQLDRMQQEVARLRQRLPLVAHDASVYDPVWTLTQSSIVILEREMARLRHALLISDKWEHLQAIAARNASQIAEE